MLPQSPWLWIVARLVVGRRVMQAMVQMQSQRVKRMQPASKGARAELAATVRAASGERGTNMA